MIDKIKIEKAVKEILEAIGEDVNREGLKDTPKRVANMYEEIFCSIDDNPDDHLTVFNSESKNSGIVALKDIPFASTCEHHLLPFVGKAYIAYIPKDGKIIGISKLVRIINVYAKRPQIQERLTAQVADYLYEKLSAEGVAVIIKAEHMCMTIRGVKAQGSTTITSEFRGSMSTDNDKKQEAILLLNN